ncbi:unnamed protein product [Effrenium voratum]|nr:unnamed protein product [Effrenium voratum]
MATQDLFDACAKGQNRYFYSGLAEGSDGLVHPDARDLVDSFKKAVGSRQQAKTNVWISCAATGASLHYDMGYNLVVQLYGSKTFELLPPEALSELALPPTGHPYARQALSVGGSGNSSNFSRFRLGPKDALYVPPLWAHRTSSGEGASISLNIFVGSKAEQLAEELSASPLPFEETWQPQELQAAVALYLSSFLTEADVPLERLRARWDLAELLEETPTTACSEAPTGHRIQSRGRAAAKRLQALPKAHRVPVALDYADDVLQGMLEPSIIRSFLHMLPGRIEVASQVGLRSILYRVRSHQPRWSGTFTIEPMAL